MRLSALVYTPCVWSTYEYWVSCSNGAEASRQIDARDNIWATIKIKKADGDKRTNEREYTLKVNLITTH